MENLILPGERVDDLQIPLEDGRSLRVIQNPEYFCFGVDAVLLANFATVPKQARIADLGCGCGVVGLLIAAKTEAKQVDGVEIQRSVADMARRSVALNGLDRKITVTCADLKGFGQAAAYDVVTCNPPYKEARGGLVSPNKYVAAARNEIFCTVADVAAASARLLKPGGRLNLIHRPERLVDVVCALRAAGIEPKRVRFVHPHADKAATMVLIEGARGGKPKLKTEPPLFIYDLDGRYSHEINRIYGKA
ncbi:hypothetical protein FACS189492_2030 [Clostridia bacterium]|nr:hypothetical protein FACS189492_2030 [Clostridia bacterium]